MVKKSDVEPEITSKDLEKLTVAKLKEELQKNNLDTTGKKAVLVERFRAFLGLMLLTTEGKVVDSPTEDSMKSPSVKSSTKGSPLKTSVGNEAAPPKPVVFSNTSSPVKSKEVIETHSLKSPASPTKIPAPEKVASPKKQDAFDGQPKKQEIVISPTSPKKDVPSSPLRTATSPTNKVGSPQKTEMDIVESNKRKLSMEGQSSPKKYKVEQHSTVNIRNFTRPLNIESLKSKLGEFGTINKVWFDRFRTRCLVFYKDHQEAKRAKEAMDNISYQPESGKLLNAALISLEDAEQDILNEGEKSIPVRSFSENTSNALDRDVPVRRQSSPDHKLTEIKYTKTTPSVPFKPFLQ